MTAEPDDASRGDHVPSQAPDGTAELALRLDEKGNVQDLHILGCHRPAGLSDLERA